MNLPEFDFVCPYCWQPNSALLDPGDRARSWVTDCEVCCRPIVLRLEPDAGTGRETLRVERES